MFDTHLAALRFTFAALFTSAVSVGTASAQSAANSDDQWRPAGVVRPANIQPAATSTPVPANQTWRLPNGQQSADASPAIGRRFEPAPPKGKAEAKIGCQPRRAAHFPSPTNAKKLATSQSAATGNAKQPSQPRQSLRSEHQASRAHRSNESGLRSIAAATAESHGNALQPPNYQRPLANEHAASEQQRIKRQHVGFDHRRLPRRCRSD